MPYLIRIHIPITKRLTGPVRIVCTDETRSELHPLDIGTPAIILDDRLERFIEAPFPVLRAQRVQVASTYWFLREGAGAKPGDSGELVAYDQGERLPHRRELDPSAWPSHVAGWPVVTVGTLADCVVGSTVLIERHIPELSPFWIRCDVLATPDHVQLADGSILDGNTRAARLTADGLRYLANLGGLFSIVPTGIGWDGRRSLGRISDEPRALSAYDLAGDNSMLAIECGGRWSRIEVAR